MTRYIIIGAGAVGASLAAEFESHGLDYVLVGRGEQIAHIAAQGLTYRRPGGTRVLALKTADQSSPPALKPGDVLLLTVKTQDVETTSQDWAWLDIPGGGLAATLPIVTFQNGLAAEEIVLRRFDSVHAASILIPARYTRTGEVTVASTPHVGVVTLGRFPHGVDEITHAIVTDLNRAGYLAEARADIRRWKAAKLIHNVGNALELFSDPPEVHAKTAEALAAEAHSILQAASHDPADPSERGVDLSSWRIAEITGDEAGGKSTWQSFVRGTSSEVDYLNGEIVRLARLHGLAAPFNAAVQAAAATLARDGAAPGTRPLNLALPA
ncbi:2-dehydropantoate 2-reductase [Xaviernesmea oryzae]|uniref:2-dehydropantoate 2-reductase n=1 Tax=Xaviernesmea oryzae TaxID=464029 RepID=A0A1Q9AQT1_9HYPH|nr:2-dehydropantoate 2-reductase N-terminal domain-containing protein [Xaviernesmea oryzae]OLP57774.1 2-dehydropantoate 2-reductase [Xaviernesmea oryzae]SEM07466.1 2-dehydropantoate 2-reductase [Xaviernesmea oryzae]